MPSAEYDLRYLQAGLGVLEQYLLSNDLYWPVDARVPPGDPPYPRLTLGNMLLAEKRLQARSLNAEQRADLAGLEEQVDATRARWRVAWGQKAAAEYHSRLGLWRDFIEDYRESPEANADRYVYEVGRRVMLHLLAQDAENVPPAEEELLSGLDKLLRAVLIPDGFIWESEIQSAFPREPYWYLYGRLKK